MAHFEIKDLTFSYPASKTKPALDGINLKVERGEYVTICGRSGCGKTTLLRHLKGVLTPHGKRSGCVFFDGKPLEEVDERTQASSIGYVMQDPDSQIVTDKVWHELAFGLESLGEDQKTIRLRVAEMASYFGIQDWFHKNVSELSGGQKQLLNLASIMAMQPSVLILDEPTSQLDPIAASDFLNTVKKINVELRTTIIITEHRLEDIFHASDRVIVMNEGRITADDVPQNIGGILNEKNDEMFAALPSPVRIYYGVKGRDAKSPDCPLTVREGGGWLDKFLENKTDIISSLSSKEELPECTDPALLMKEVWFRYEKDAPDVLRGVSMSVPRNTLFAVVGGNGTGKSTMLKAVCDICRPYRGKIKVDGKPIQKYKPGELFRNGLAMLPQDPRSLFVKKTVREELEEMLTAAERKDLSELNEIAELCDVKKLFDSHPYDLSGGEQQRTALAKVLLTHPKLLLLDEPTKGMDGFFKEKLSAMLEELKKRGVTIVMVSHDVEFCARYADSISMFFDGSIITTNTPAAFFSGNSFYTTAANRMSRHVFDDAVTDEDVIRLCRMNEGE